MQAEEIILHCVRVILLIGSLTKVYLIWNYLNKKPLGMQTILDQVIKDFIRLGIIGLIPSSLATFKFEQPYAIYTARAILIFFKFGTFCFIWQLCVTAIIRYLSVRVS